MIRGYRFLALANLPARFYPPSRRVRDAGVRASQQFNDIGATRAPEEICDP
jgi:hypothetical protein